MWFCGGVCIFVWSLFAALCFLGVGLWVVVLFENSIVCHLMKQTLFVYEHEHERERGHQIVIDSCWCLLFVVVLLVSLFFACNFLFVFLESLILAQDERWRRA